MACLHKAIRWSAERKYGASREHSAAPTDSPHEHDGTPANSINPTSPRRGSDLFLDARRCRVYKLGFGSMGSFAIKYSIRYCLCYPLVKMRAAATVHALCERPRAHYSLVGETRDAIRDSSISPHFLAFFMSNSLPTEIPFAGFSIFRKTLPS